MCVANMYVCARVYIYIWRNGGKKSCGRIIWEREIKEGEVRIYHKKGFFLQMGVY